MNSLFLVEHKKIWLFHPKKVLKRWREQFSWLDITNNKTLICKICCSQEDKLCSMPNISMSFISGSSNYRLSALKDHDNSACHQRAICEKEHEEALHLENLYHQEKLSFVHLLPNHQYI